jgi:hypothetical protein
MMSRDRSRDEHRRSSSRLAVLHENAVQYSVKRSNESNRINRIKTLDWILVAFSNYDDVHLLSDACLICGINTRAMDNHLSLLFCRCR